MHQSLESSSTSEEYSQSKTNNYKERAMELLNRSNTGEKDLIDFSIELRKNPLIEVEVPEKLFTENTFEIFEKTKLNPVFILNLINIINIANFVWNCTKKNILLFHKVLLGLNIMFSYLPNNGQFEYVVLSTIPLLFYELVAEKGKNCFKKSYSFDKDYLSPNTNNTQIGLVYEANTVTQLNTLINHKKLDAPTIMYYLNHNKCLDLFKGSIFNRPENFSDLAYKSYFDFHGYNEIDYSFILQENVELKQNLIFNKVVENNEIKTIFNSDKDLIKLPKDTNIFVEIKTKFDSYDYITNLKPKSDTFLKAYGNLAFHGLEEKFKKDKSEYYLLFNSNRDDALRVLKNAQKVDKDDKKGNENEISNKDINVLYNSGYVQIASIVSLQNQIRSINNKMVNMAEESEKEKLQMKNDIAKQKEEFDDKLAKQKEELKKETDNLLKKMQINNEILKFIVSHPANLNSIEKIYDSMSSKSTAFDIFKLMNKNYKTLCSKVIDNNNLIINLTDKLIGKILESKEEINDFRNLLFLLNSKISENTFVQRYYNALKDILTGPNWNNPKNIKSIDLFSKSKNCEIIKNIFKFVTVLEMEELLENQFFEAVLFYVSEISINDIGCYNLFVLYSKKDDMKKNVTSFIRSLNSEFHKSLV